MLKLLYFFAVILVSQITINEGYRFGAPQVRAIAASVCNSNECLFGTCEITSATTYQCHCSAGVTGTNCNTQAVAGNPCSSNPCFAGGICTNVGTTGFTCTCPSGLAGPTCRGVLGNCACQNSGTCTASVFGGLTVQTCTCPAGFSGNLCQYSVSAYQSCFSAGCQNGGTCTILSTCSCPSGFSGNLCQFATAATTTSATTVTNQLTIPLCSSGICRNGGICTQISYNIATCTCVNGFTGIYCNVPPVTTTTVAPTTTTASTTTVATTTVNSISACPANLQICQNQGTCTYNTVTNAINCNCLPNFSGPTCTTKVPFCSVNPCQNGGTCVTTNSPASGDGTCTCATGFSGTLCDISSCNAATTCNSNGVCINNGATMTCLCFAPFTGPNCATQ